MGCIFCGIVEGKLPSAKLYEDGSSLAFLDIRPLVPGHALVVPKAHCSDLRDLPAGHGGPLLEAAQRLAPALIEAVEADGFNLIVANGAAAGQEVLHLHLHVLPRKTGDGFTKRSLADSVKAAKNAGQDDLARLAEKVRGLLTAAK